MRFSRYLGSLLLAALLALGALAPAFAQDQGGPQVAVVSVDNNAFPLLTLTLSVVDSSGQPVRGLTPGAITVTEDGQPAEVTAVKDITEQELGIGVVLVIDVSGSMAGASMEAARTAATGFINRLGPNDQLAILAFDRTVRTLMPFGGSKSDAATIIGRLTQTPGGATALYDAALQGVRTAAASTLSRHMVILLSDGREYVSDGQNTSLSSRDEAYRAAKDEGVTIHTIGLGNQIDEAYLRQLSGLTGGVYLPAPTPTELEARWQTIADFMRQLVEVQVRSGAKGDHQSHNLSVSVLVGKQTAEAKGIFFSKAVAPVITAPGLPQTPLAALTAVTARVEAAEVVRVAFSVDGQPLSTATSAPWEASLDPLKFLPGAHTLTIQATDANGLTGTVDARFEVAALPPTVKLSVTEGQLLDQPLSVTPEITAQGQVQSVSLEIDGQAVTLSGAPYRFELDPQILKGGVHKLTLKVTDSQGQTTTTEVGFSVAIAPSTAAHPTLVAGATATPGSATASASVPIALIVVAIVVLAGVVAFVLLRRAPAGAAKVRGPALRIVSGLEKGQVFPITATPQLIGRHTSAPIHLSDPSGALQISREHARVWLEGGAAWIEDAGSRHGTYADGHRLVAPLRLASGTRIKVGEVELVAEGITVSEEDLRATSFNPLPKEDSDAASRETRVSAASEERETRLKAPEAEPGDEASHPTLLMEEEERQTRLKPADASAEPGDVAARATVLAEAQRQTRLKPDEAAPSPEELADANRATRMATPLEAGINLGDETQVTPARERSADNDGTRQTKLKQD